MDTIKPIWWDVCFRNYEIAYKEIKKPSFDCVVLEYLYHAMQERQKKEKKITGRHRDECQRKS